MSVCPTASSRLGFLLSQFAGVESTTHNRPTVPTVVVSPALFVVLLTTTAAAECVGKVISCVRDFQAFI